MMPTIRIDDDVFAALQAIATPFTDTPNSVIRRLLAERAATPNTSGPRAPERETPTKPFHQTGDGGKTPYGTLIPQPVYEAYLLHTLATKFGGRAHKRDVTAAVVEMMKSRGLISARELEKVSTGETRAENTIAWGRNVLKKRGLLSRHSPRGTWELTAKGIEEAKHATLPTR